MTIRAFLRLVEIRTKAASVFPFLFGLAYAEFRFGSINAVNAVLMFVSLLCFDMATTALNNYADYKKARRREGYNYETHNAVAAYGLGERTVLAAIFALVGLAVAAGIALSLKTGLATLVLGAFSFAVGIAYSAGPLPISRTPFGELFSGTLMGFVIPLLAVHVSAPAGALMAAAVEWPRAGFSVDAEELLRLAIAASPLVFGIADIMLANNICDMAEDAEEGRATLPLSVGKRGALGLFAALALSFPVPIVLSIALGTLPTASGISLAALPFVVRSTAAFRRLQTKKDTFALAVKNFALTAALYAAGTAIGIFISV